MQGRDRERDFVIYQELKQIKDETRAYEDEQRALRRAREEAEEKARFEQWWQSPATTFEDKLLYRPQEALQEELSRPGTLLQKSCRVLKKHHYYLSEAAAALGLAYEIAEGPSELPPGSDIQQCEIIGDAAAVQKQAKEFKKSAEKAAQEAWSSYNAKMEARNAAKEAKRKAFIAEASVSGEWDLTGKWSIKCDKLATYRSTSPPDKLRMTIYKDDYHLDAVCHDEPNPEDDYGTDLEEEPRARKKKQPKQDSPSDQQRPRFCARFDFGVVEGIMRIYPIRSARKTPDWSGIKQNPTFEYRWRGRETGENEIQPEALKFVRNITFSECGTEFEALFDCPYISGPVRIIGTRKSHGRGQKFISAQEWSELNEKAYHRESSRRWGGW